MAQRPVALITGASGGIGLEFARIFAREGYDVVLVARSKDKLTKLAASIGPGARVIAADLSHPDEPARVMAEAGEIDVLVNNAGFGLWGPFLDSDLDRELEMIRLNIAAVTVTTKLAIRQMVPRRRGQILNVASLAAFSPGPFAAVYYATKAYVLHFTEGIAEELRDSGVTVSAFCPGPIETGFAAVAAAGNTGLFAKKPPSAQAMAKAAYEGLMAGKVVIVPTFENRLTILPVRFVPRSMVRKVTRGMNEPR